jgi:hypothetical protein
MPSFSSELNAAWKKRAKALGRDPTQEEGEVIEAELVQAWISAKRFDELITRFLSQYGREGGHIELIVLGHALRKNKDLDRTHKLFRSVVTRRTNAFWQSWPKAATGHIGHMRDAAKYMSEAMLAYTEYVISLDALGMTAERELLRAEMLSLQDRIKPKKTRKPT